MRKFLTPIDLGSNQIHSVADPTSIQDAATKNYVDTLNGAITKKIAQTAHGFTVGNLVYYTGSTYAVSDNTASSTAEVDGIVTTVIDANNFIITQRGYVTGLSSLTAGTTYFLGTSGALTATAPATVGYVRKPVLHADSTTSGYFNNYLGVTVSASATGNVTGPSSATDMSIALFDGTSGTLLKDSPVTMNAIGTIFAYAFNASSGGVIAQDGINGLQINNATTISKIARFDSSGISASTTRTFAFPNVSGTFYVSSGPDVAVADGGTGASTLTGILIGNGTSAVTGVTTSAGVASALSDETGSGSLVFATAPSFTTSITMSAANIITDTTTGMKIGTATTQKLGFFNATPVVQQIATTDLGTVLSDLGLRAAGTAYPITTSGAVAFSGTVSLASATMTFANNQIPAAALATNAITLGKLVYTTSQTSFSSTSVTAMTGMTLAVTIPAGGRSIKVSVLIPNIINTSAATNIWISIWDGAVGTGTQLQEVVTTPAVGSSLSNVYAYAIVTPSAGSKTYNIGWRIQANSISTQLSATVPAIIHVEAI